MGTDRGFGGTVRTKALRRTRNTACRSSTLKKKGRDPKDARGQGVYRSTDSL